MPKTGKWRLRLLRTTDPRTVVMTAPVAFYIRPSPLSSTVGLPSSSRGRAAGNAAVSILHLVKCRQGAAATETYLTCRVARTWRRLT